MDTLDTKELEAAAEGILFAAGEPVHIDRVCLALEIGRAEAEQVLRRLMDYYAFERRGIRLVRMGEEWQMCSSTDYAAVIRRAFEIRRPAKLSQPALEVLAIIAYNQPVTRGFVEQVRGVDSSSVVTSLVEKGLVEEAGRLELPGRPIAYRTTPVFLRCFGLESLDHLPDVTGSGEGPPPEEDGQMTLEGMHGEEDTREELPHSIDTEDQS